MRNYAVGYLTGNDVRITTVAGTNADRALDTLVDEWGTTFIPLWIGEIALQFESDVIREVKALDTPRWRVAGPLDA